MLFSRKYFICTLILLITEVLIAAFMHDSFIRPTFGDFLVVILMYCGWRSFIRSNYRVATITVLLISYIIEVSQYFHLIAILGLKGSVLAQCILGSGFAWGDMIAYTMGAMLIWLVESHRAKKLLVIQQ